MRMRTVRSKIKSLLIHKMNGSDQEQELRDWEKKGRPVPPPHAVKIEAIKKYAKKFSLSTLVETGTYLGATIDATKETFRKIISVELDTALHERAKRKFSKFEHILLIQGDSGEVLPSLLTDLTHPCLFWLDGHFSGGITAQGKLDTPIVQELVAISPHFVKGHVILIDDARLFNGQNSYPTISELQRVVSEKYGDCAFEIKDDIIRIHQKM